MKAFILALAMVLGTPLAIADETVADSDKICQVIVDYPKEIEVGELAIIDVSESLAVNVVWERMPTTPDFCLFDEGKTAAFSARTPGEYIFIIAGATGDSPDVAIIKITVVGAAMPSLAGFDLKVAQWCAMVDSDTKKEDVLKLANSFASVASILATTLQPTVAELIQATAESNKQSLGEQLTAWAPFSEALKVELRARATAGELPDTQAHIQLWKEIAASLRRYAESL